MKDKERELQFLQIIRVNGNIFHLTQVGWTYSDILLSINDYSKKGIVSVSDRKTMLTQKGQLYFKSLYNSLGKKGVSRFLTHYSIHKTNRLPIKSVYLPKIFRANEEF